MTERPRIFSEEWRKCLSEHYKTVALRRDTNLEQCYTEMLSRVNFTEQELESLRIGLIAGSSNQNYRSVQRKNVPDTNVQEKQNTTLSDSSSSIQVADVMDGISVLETIVSEETENSSDHQGFEDDGQEDMSVAENNSSDIPQPKLFD